MNKIYNGIMGLVVGDALGVPAEFKKRDTYKITDMTGFGTHNQPPGTWSDDSSMTLATLESIGRLKKIDLNDIMRNFCRWLYEGEFTPYGKVFDVGGTTRRAIERYAEGAAIGECGGREVTNNGNGALMRVLPLTFAKGDYKAVCDVAGLTHRHGISIKACVLYVSAADKILREVSFEEVLEDMCSDSWSRTIGLRDVRGIGREEVKSTGYVVDTLEAGLWCLYNTDSYRDCVMTAVNLGDDTDTVAAVAGGLAGLMYGCGGKRGIPDEWIRQIPRREWIKGLCDKLVDQQESEENNNA